MKRSKRLSVLFGILVLVCAATFAVTRFEERKEQIKSSGETVLEVPVEDIQSLRWEYGGTTLSFHKEGIWLYDDDESFPVDEEKIRRLLEPFEAFGVSFIIEDVSDYGMYGLDAPECTIWFETETQSYQIDLGDFSSMDQERYISLGDGNVYLAKADPLDQFDVALRDLICHDEDLRKSRRSNLREQKITPSSMRKKALPPIVPMMSISRKRMARPCLWTPIGLAITWKRLPPSTPAIM